METTAENLMEKYVGKPARVCPACGSNRVWLPITGGMRCQVCKPSKSDYETVLVAVETEAGLRWSKPSDFDDEIGGTIPGGPKPNPPGPLVTIKPIPHSRDVFVSTKLDWFCLQISTMTDFADEESEETYRKLDERYFAWLNVRVMSLDKNQQIEAISLLWEIAIEGLNAGVLPPAMIDKDNWPVSVPKWYRGPLTASEHGKEIGI